MATKKFLEAGSPLQTTIRILKTNQMITIENPNSMHSDNIAAKALCRIHSETKGRYLIWILDEGNMNTIQIHVPLHLMGQYFEQHEHNLFPHLK